MKKMDYFDLIKGSTGSKSDNIELTFGDLLRECRESAKEIVEGKWFIYIPEEGDWPIKYTGDSKEEAKAAYLKWANRKSLPAGSKIWQQKDVDESKQVSEQDYEEDNEELNKDETPDMGDRSKDPDSDVPPPPDEVKDNDTPMEMRKEYLGKSEETHYYFITTESGTGDIDDFVIADQDGLKKYSAKDQDMEISEEGIADFLIAAIRDMTIATIERSIFLKYIYPKLDEEEPELPEEEEEEEFSEKPVEEPAEEEEKPPRESVVCEPVEKLILEALSKGEKEVLYDLIDQFWIMKEFGDEKRDGLRRKLGFFGDVEELPEEPGKEKAPEEARSPRESVVREKKDNLKEGIPSDLSDLSDVLDKISDDYIIQFYKDHMMKVDQDAESIKRSIIRDAKEDPEFLEKALDYFQGVSSNESEANEQIDISKLGDDELVAKYEELQSKIDSGEILPWSGIKNKVNSMAELIKKRGLDIDESKLQELAGGIVRNIVDMLLDRGYEVDFKEVFDFVEDLSVDEYDTLVDDIARGQEESVMEILSDLDLRRKDESNESNELEESKNLIEMKVTDDKENIFDVYLMDNGEEGTTISISGMEHTFSQYSEYFRDEQGKLTEEGLKELALDVLANLPEEDYNELAARAGEEENQEGVAEPDVAYAHNPQTESKENIKGNDKMLDEVRIGADFKRDKLIDLIVNGSDTEVNKIWKILGYREETPSSHESTSDYRRDVLQDFVNDATDRRVHNLWTSLGYQENESKENNKGNGAMLNEKKTSWFTISPDEAALDAYGKPFSELDQKQKIEVARFFRGPYNTTPEKDRERLERNLPNVVAEIEAVLAKKKTQESKETNKGNDKMLDEKTVAGLLKDAERAEAKAKARVSFLRKQAADQKAAEARKEADAKAEAKAKEKAAKKKAKESVESEEINKKIDETDVSKGTKALIKLAKAAAKESDYAKAAEHYTKLAEIEAMVPAEAEAEAEKITDEPEAPVEEPEEPAEEPEEAPEEELDVEESEEVAEDVVPKEDEVVKEARGTIPSGVGITYHGRKGNVDRYKNGKYLIYFLDADGGEWIDEDELRKQDPAAFESKNEKKAKPVCKKCSKAHWPFEKCGKAKKESKIKLEDIQDISETKSMESLRNLLDM